MMRCCFLMVLGVVASSETVVRLRLGNGSVRRLVGETLEDVRRGAGIDAEEAVFIDEACSIKVEETACLSHGSILYLQQKKFEKKKEDVIFSPYPKFALKDRRRLQRRVQNMAKNDDIHEIVKPESRLCSEARVSPAFERLFHVEPSLFYVYGRRDGTALFCEIFGRAQEATLAAGLGMHCIGCVVIGDELTARDIVATAKAQLAVMTDEFHNANNNNLPAQFPFVLLLVQSNQTALEAFEVSEHLVQIAAEGLLEESHDQLVHFAQPVKLPHRAPTQSLEIEWLYQPVPIVPYTDETFFSQADHPPFDAPKKMIDSALAKILLKKDLSDQVKVRRLPDFLLLNRFRSLVTRRDFTTLLAFLRHRREASLLRKKEKKKASTGVPPAIATILRLARTKLLASSSTTT